jgi:hypothetical protein
MTFPVSISNRRRCYVDRFSQSHYRNCPELFAAVTHFDNPDRAILSSSYRAK